jgi:hypothetical protein
MPDDVYSNAASTCFPQQYWLIDFKRRFLVDSLVAGAPNTTDAMLT